MNRRADGLALLLRVGDARKFAEEARRGVHMDERDVVGAAEQALHLLRLALAQQAVIDEDAGERVADGLVQQDGGDGGIDAAGQAADHLRAAHLLADARDLGISEGRHRPGAAAARDAVHEVPQHGRAARRMHDFGMELHAIEAPPLVGDGGVGRIAAGGDGREAFRQGRDAVAMAHPDRRGFARPGHALEQRRRRLDLDQRRPVLALARWLDHAAEPVDHALLAVADAEHRDAGLEHGVRNLRRAFVENAGRSAGQDDRLRLERRDGLPGGVKRHDL